MKRGGGLKRGRGPARGVLRTNAKKKARGFNRRRLRTPTEIEVANKEAFQDAARAQRVCAVTRRAGPFDPHHVIYQQHLEDFGLPRYDTRNVLRVTRDAHDAHHRAFRRIKTRELTDDNIRYAFHELGERAADYFARYYDDSDPDPRIAALAA